VLDDADPERIAIMVEDDGPGIAAEEREKVFEPFYRSDLARTLREGSGFGLGLAIVRAIAEGHRGELTLSERPGGGLRAVIAWPRRW
jgi:signal transduction histidine kinase